MLRSLSARVAAVLAAGAWLALDLHAQAAPPRTGTGGPSRVRPATASGASAELDGFGAGTVVSVGKISCEVGGFPQDTLDEQDHFGSSAASLGDLDADGVPDLVVGAVDDDDGGLDHGAVYVMFLRTNGSARAFEKISARAGGFTGAIDARDRFGCAVAALGDLDGDGLGELAVGASGDDDGGGERGAVWVLYLRADGSVRTHTKISSTSGSLGIGVDNFDGFGSALATLGDLDGDGYPELAVGAPGDDDGGSGRGAVWILFLQKDGSVRARQKISQSAGDFGGTLRNADGFGGALGALGVRADGTSELAIGASGDDDGGSGRGALWVLTLGADGRVRAQQKISATQGGFTGVLDDGDQFGCALAGLGDLDGNGALDLAVGAIGDDDHDPAAFEDVGAVWLLRRALDGSVASFQKISDTQGGLTALLRSHESFGSALATLPDMDGNGVPELCACTSKDSEGSTVPYEWGAAYALFLRPEGTVRQHRKIGFTEGGLPSTLDPTDELGSSVAALDLDRDGVLDLAVGAEGDRRPEITGVLEGAVWLLFLDADGRVKGSRKIGNPESSLAASNDLFGSAVAALGDLDGDGLTELAVGARGSADFGANMGAVWILSLDASGVVQGQLKIAAQSGGFGGALAASSEFGSSLASLGDVDGDGIVDLAVGARGDGLGTLGHRGALWILFLNRDGTVRDERKLPSAGSGFEEALIGFDLFGSSVAGLGDLDGDGVGELAVGAPFRDDGGSDKGAVWVLFLTRDGSVSRYVEIGDQRGGFGALPNDSGLGSALAAVGDLDRDRVGDLCAGAFVASDGFANAGVAYVLLLNADGSVKAQQRIAAPAGQTNTGALFGAAVAALDDRDGDGARDVVVGAPRDDDGGSREGALWLLGLDGVAVLDFEGGDDPLRTPLAHGRSLATSGEFGRTVEILGAGPNLGPAIFDTRRRTDVDPELSGALGNVCILQDAAFPAQSSPDVFARPDDAEAGGTIRIRFRAPVELASLDLVGADKAHVVLFDGAGRERTYRVPGGWTGDLVADGAPGYRTLDLRTLDPQRGFAALATAVEDPGFDARDVLVLELFLHGSGALDNVRWDPHPGS